MGDCIARFATLQPDLQGPAVCKPSCAQSILQGFPCGNGLLQIAVGIELEEVTIPPYTVGDPGDIGRRGHPGGDIQTDNRKTTSGTVTDLVTIIDCGHKKSSIRYNVR